MPICFGINANNELRAVYYLCFIIALILPQLDYTYVLDKSQKSVFMFRMPNVTLVTMDLYDDIPYGDCRCSIVSTKDCLTDKQLRSIRIGPLILLIVQIYLIREHLSFTGDHRYIFANVYWIVSILIFLGLSITIYRSSRHYQFILMFLFFVSLVLFGLVGIQIMPEYRDRLYPDNSNIIDNDSGFEWIIDTIVEFLEGINLI